MNTEPLSSQRYTLNIDFDLHTDGDMQFKSELVLLLIDNIEELRQSLKAAISQGQQKYSTTLHKITPTISMLNDIELTEALNCLRDHLKSENEIGSTFLDKMAFVDHRCHAIVDQLQKEV